MYMGQKTVSGHRSHISKVFFSLMSLSCFPLSKSSALISFAVKQIKIKRANLRPFLVDRPVRLAVVFQISSLVFIT